MSKTVQHKGGSTVQNNSYTGAPRELTVDTTKNTLRVHDGVTVGGTELARLIDIPAPSLPAIGAAPPASPLVGGLWWDSAVGNMYIFYNDGDSSQWVPVTANAGPKGDPGFGLSPAYYNLGTISGTVNINLTNSDTQIGTLSGNTTIVLPALAAGQTRQLTLIITNSSAGGHAITVPSVAWIGQGAPQFNVAANARNILLFRGIDGLWIGDGGPVA